MSLKVIFIIRLHSGCYFVKRTQLFCIKKSFIGLLGLLYTLSLDLRRYTGFNFLILLILVSVSVDSYASELQIGNRAPNLRGHRVLNDAQISLYRMMTEMRLKKDANGKLILGENGKYINEYHHFVTVLNFFAKTCIPCLREIPTFNRLEKNFRGHPVKFLYINVDPHLPRAKARTLMDRYHIEMPMMWVNQNEAIRKYGAQTLPRLVVIGKNKKISKIITGFHKNLESELTRYLNQLLE